ncbi:hypothetical protein IEQ34_000692 [Dendrobium chrysotoxum]|uniref:Uncharacterized protein n=1 Tax=Dendrobium chrysotoxum TaxID=161865 RepID=A0AAV7HAY8_DENCH|nr:hypothetical protein IEQ34_000692 [Dendrobium chrysotoxum]
MPLQVIKLDGCAVAGKRWEVDGRRKFATESSKRSKSIGLAMREREREREGGWVGERGMKK